MRPARWPRVRATRGSRSGPITISATMPITSSSENPMSNMGTGEQKGARRRPLLPVVWRRQALDSVLERTSPSTTLPVTCGAGPASAGFSPPSRMPSLKPRTAPPRSAPMLRNFLVPKISTTIKRTTSQCQTLNEPITTSYRALFPPHEHRAERLRTPEDVHVEMIHLLMPDAPGVDDDAKAVRRPLPARQFPRQRQHLAERPLLRHSGLVERRYMLLGNHQDMDRGLRPEVVKSEYIVVFVDFARGDFAARDAAKNAARSFALSAHAAPSLRLRLRAAFSSMPEMTSRRCSSASTSCGPSPWLASMIRQ